MMTLTKYNTADYRPTTFRSLVDQFFNDDFHGGATSAFSSSADLPSVDIAEMDKAFEIELHAPGMKKADFNIDLNENQITVSGERKQADDKAGKTYHTRRSYYGSFSKTFNLPELVDRNKIEAKYEAGILTITLPKDEKRILSKQIAIK